MWYMCVGKMCMIVRIEKVTSKYMIKSYEYRWKSDICLVTQLIRAYFTSQQF